jgi:hypothetical protein
MCSARSRTWCSSCTAPTTVGPAPRNELKQIVGKIRATGADVILVAPTMSLTDLAWLLPYRETALSLRDELDCPVLDGTLALWPVDESVHSLEDVHHYLARHFPPNGDDIHPWFSGHFQMGRRLWEQLGKGPAINPLTFELETPEPLRMEGRTRLALTITNRSKQPFKGAVQVFFPQNMPIAESAPVTEKLPNPGVADRMRQPASHVLARAALWSRHRHFHRSRQLSRLPRAAVLPEHRHGK